MMLLNLTQFYVSKSKGSRPRTSELTLASHFPSVTPGKLFKHSVVKIPHLENGDGNSF